MYEGIVLHDQDRKQKAENYIAMKFQKGTVYPSGKNVKMGLKGRNLKGLDEIRRSRSEGLLQVLE